MTPHRILAAAALLAPATLAAQQPPADTARTDGRTRRDSAAVRLEEVVTVGRARVPLLRSPWAVGIADARELRRGQPTVGLDEALAAVPGVYVANRYNYAVDARVAVRGAGSRANFGLRGLRVLLDGVPQTLPDGQSQLTNVELANVGRVEVLRGAASSLYGNGSGGVLAFETDMAAPAPFQQQARVTAGSYGLRKLQSRTAGRAGRAVGVLSLTRTTVDGFRAHSAADLRQLNLAGDWAADPRTTLSVRLNAAETPRAENPGALTAAEYARDPSLAAVTAVQRGADRRIGQQQLAVVARRRTAGGTELLATAYGLRRDVRNALATVPAGGGTTAASGVYGTIDRGAGGARTAGSFRLGGDAAPLITVGAEAQRMRDRRRNARATGGRPTLPTDTLVLDQLETVTGVAPFAGLSWAPAGALLVDAGARFDRVAFAVDDRFARDGRDNSGRRAMTAWSGHAGASWAARPALVPYVNVGSAFETPTTTELQARPDALGGFNDALGPQRSLSVEAGARGGVALGRAGRLSYTASAYRAAIDDAIVQFSEVGGRAFFRNAGRARHAGAELGLDLRPRPLVGVTAAYTWSRFRFVDYVAAGAAGPDTLDGRRIPGVPVHFWRTGLRLGPARGVTFDVDHAHAGALFADDRNLQRVPGWGRGIVGARAAWSGGPRSAPLEAFAGVQNALAQKYVSAVTVNGGFGRVLEPGPGRTVYAGVELGWRAGSR